MASGDDAAFDHPDIEQCIGARFSQQVRKYPQHTALATESGEWCYRELCDIVAQTANSIVSAHGVQKKPAAVLLDHDAPLIATLFALLSIGRIYVSLDRHAPAARLREIVRESGAELLITDGSHMQQASKLDFGGDILNIDEMGSTRNPGLPDVDVRPDDIAFIVYTSGSTGRPKGVYYDHRSLLHNIMRYTNDLRITPGDRLTLFYSCSVIGAIRDIYGALLNGACLCPYDVRRSGTHGMAHWLRSRRVTVYNSVTTLFREFSSRLDQGQSFPDVRIVRFGGEAVLRSDIAGVARHFPPHCRVYAGFGTSETGTVRRTFIDPRAPHENGTASTGYPVPDVDVRLVDRDDNPVAVGEVGEICVASRYIALGYWKRPDLTRRAFRTEPGDPAVRVYRTGDLGRLLADGSLEVLGRKDAQVKIRGNRVEIGEIEMVLCSHPGVRQAAVTAPRDEHGTVSLAAYVTASDAAKPDATALRSYVRERLPGHMVPATVVLIDELPLTASGKVDRARLTALAGSENTIRESPEGSSPRNATELTIARIWLRSLGKTSVGIDDDFFDHGGDSLRAMSMLSEMEDAFGVAPGLDELIPIATVRRLAAWLQSRDTHLSALHRVHEGSGTPLFFVPGGTGGDLELALIYRELSARLGSEHSFYGLSARYGDAGEIPQESVESIATAFVEVIRDVQPTGPYLIGGECIGGPIAFEIACQLEQQGEQITLLVLMDSRLPSSTTQLVTAWNRLRLRVRQRGRHVALLCARVVHHAGRLLREGPSTRAMGYIVDKGRQARRLTSDERNLSRIRRLSRDHAHLVYRYRPRRFNGRLVLIVPRDSLKHGRTAGWTRHVRGGVEIHEVPGNHRTYLTGENIDETARVLRACLQDALLRGSRPDLSTG